MRKTLPDAGDPPGPRGAAVRQSLRQLRQHPLPTLLRLHQQYGDIVCLPRWSQTVYLVRHPAALHHVLHANAGNYRKGRLLAPVRALQGEGLLTSEGETWRQQRRLLQPFWRPQHLARYDVIIQEEVQALAQAWRPLAQTGQACNVVAWMQRLTFRIIGRAVLGLAPEALDPLGRQLQALARRLAPGLSAALASPWSRWLPTRRQWRFARAINDYHALAQALIDVRQRTRTPADTDLLAVLLAAHETPGAPVLSPQHLRDMVITLIGAGVEPTAHALSWTWWLLATHPEVSQRLQAEVDTVLPPRPATLADLPYVPYSRMVLDEALRLYPPAALVSRQARAADKLGGYAIPPDAVLLLSPYVMHRHPAYWSEPERFDPERFDAARLETRPRGVYLPFGLGPRHCIGQGFALRTMQLALVTLARAYTLRLVPEHPVLPRLAITLQPAAGLWMTVQAR